MNPMLKVQEKTTEDDSIQSYERFGYKSITGTNLNTPSPIVIRVENSDNFFRPCDSELQFSGKVVKAADGAVIKKAEAKTALINNGILHLFDCIKYDLSGNEIETLYHPGPAINMLGILTYPASYNESGGLGACWSLDDGTGKAEAANHGWENRKKILFENNEMAAAAEDPNSGSFRFSIRLDQIFGFASDYRKVLYGFVHTLTLIRNLDDNNAFLTTKTAGTKCKILFDEINWILPSVTPSDVAKYELVKLINEQVVLSINFRVRQCITTMLPKSTQNFFWRVGIRTAPEKPRFLVVGFQTARDGDQEENNGLFDHCDLTNTYVLLNNQRYPAMDYHTDFGKNHYDTLYREFYQFLSKFHGIPTEVTSSSIDPISYKHLFPLVVYDVRHQSERIKQAVVDITIQCYFSKNVPEKTKAFCLMISDRRLKFKSDGQKMGIVY